MTVLRELFRIAAVPIAISVVSLLASIAALRGIRIGWYVIAACAVVAVLYSPASTPVGGRP